VGLLGHLARPLTPKSGAKAIVFLGRDNGLPWNAALDVRVGSWSCKNAGGQPPKGQFCGGNYALIAAISGLVPMMFISQYVQRHLGGNPWQRLHQEVGCAHPGVDRAEGMLDRLAPLAHLLRMLVEPSAVRPREYAHAPNG